MSAANAKPEPPQLDRPIASLVLDAGDAVSVIGDSVKAIRGVSELLRIGGPEQDRFSLEDVQRDNLAELMNCIAFRLQHDHRAALDASERVRDAASRSTTATVARRVT